MTVSLVLYLLFLGETFLYSFFYSYDNDVIDVVVKTSFLDYLLV